MDRFDNEKRREFVEKLKNSKKKKCEIVQLCLERMIFKKSIRRIVALFVDSLGSNERLEILNGKFGTIIETRSYDGLKKHEGLKGRRLMGKTRFEKFDLAERKGGNERRIAAAGRARRISGSPPREDLYVQWSLGRRLARCGSRTRNPLSFLLSLFLETAPLLPPFS